MSANVETAAYANVAAWHNEGMVLDTNGDLGMDVDTAIEASGLNWTVDTVPVFGFAPEDMNTKTGMPKSGATPIKIDGRFGTQRSSDNKILGVVGSAYRPVQNIDGFQIIDDLLQSNECWIESAGALNGGKKVWILAHMYEDLQIAGEQISQYILFTNGHDGRGSVTAAMTNVRVVCQNTLSFALETTERQIRLRHTSRVADRMTQAKSVLGLRDQYAEELAKQGEWLVEQEMSEGDFDKFLEQLLPTTEETSAPHETMILNRRDDIRTVYNRAKNLDSIRGTRWGALQAVVEYADHKRQFKTNDLALRAQLNDQPIKNAAFNKLITA